MSDIPLPLPPHQEQLRIAAKIEELFSKLDAGVAALERVQANLKRYRAAVLKAAVEGKLTEQWRAEHPDVEPASKLLERILAERRRKWEEDQLAKYAEKDKKPPKNWQSKYKEPVAPDRSELLELPEGWCWATVDQLAAVGTGTTPLRSEGGYWHDGSIPWVASSAVNARQVWEPTQLVTARALDETTLKLYPPHTLIVALYGEGKTRGKVAQLRIEASVNQALAALVMSGTAARCRNYLRAFLEYSYEAVRSQSAGGVQPNLNLGLVKAILVPLPPLGEQNEIVAEVERRLSVAEQLGAQADAGVARSVRLRQSILKRAFEGKLVPQDPNDEPAGVLLERIRRAHP